MNLGEIELFEVFLKVPVIIIIRASENSVLGLIYINVYQFWRWVGGAHGLSYSNCLLLIKIKKLNEHNLS